MSGFNPRFTVNLLLCVVGFVLGRGLFFPGFVDPWVPSHSDLYLYFNIAQSDIGPSMWLRPRPLLYIFLSLAGKIFTTPEALWISLSALCVLFIGALVNLFEKLSHIKFNPYAVVLYATSIFSLPTSWQIYQLDCGGMLSGLLCIASIHVFLKAKARQWLYVFAALLFWAALEAKPTFGVLLPLAAAVYAARQRSRESLAVLVTVISIGMFVVLKDKFLGSPFVSSDEGNVYQVRIDPAANLSAVVQYLKAAIPLSLLPGVVLAYFYALRTASTRVPAAWMPAAALAAIAPMALIPNRVMDLYAWYVSIFLFAPVLSLGTAMQGGLSVPRKLATLATVILMCLGLWHVCWSLPSSCAWVRSIASYNANIMSSLGILKSAAPAIADGRLLVAGLRGPYHAFWDPSFVRHVTGIKNYTRLLRKSEAEWNVNIIRQAALEQYLSDLARASYGQYFDELDLSSYRYYAIYNTNGDLSLLLTRDQLQQIPEWWRRPVVYGVGRPDLTTLSKTDFANAVRALYQDGEKDAAMELLKSLRAEGHLPVTVEDFGPKNTTAGQPFNVQPNGESAMWVAITGILETSDNRIQFGDISISHIVYEVDRITFVVPAQCFSTPGTKQIFFVEGGTGQQWKIGDFNVEKSAQPAVHSEEKHKR